MSNPPAPIRDEVAAENQRLMIRFCMADLDFALLQIELARSAINEQQRELHVASARRLYERVRGMVLRMPLGGFEEVDIKVKLGVLERTFSDREGV